MSPPSSLQSPVSSLQSPAAPAADTLVRVEGVSKKFCLSLKKSLWYGLQDMGRELTGRSRATHGERLETTDSRLQTASERLETTDYRPQTTPGSLQSPVSSLQSNSLGLRPKEFWAVNDVSFELKRGECLGLIGRNGAGKTTLLRMLNGLIKPDAGRIEMSGRVGALIALGAGFNPILTGRENIYTNASVLGLTKKETDAKLDEIIDFAEIGDFIDTPVQNYSSGMAVRLGFAIASTLEPEILLIDEVLAVGDISFRLKCLNRIRSIMHQTAVILVSHSMEYISSICNRAVVLEKGKSTDYGGDVMSAIEAYNSVFKTTDPQSVGGTEVILKSIKLHSTSGRHKEGMIRVKNGETLGIEMCFKSNRDEPNAIKPWIHIADWGSREVLGIFFPDAAAPYHLNPRGELTLRVDADPVQLSGGRYSISVGCSSEKTGQSLMRVDNAAHFWVANNGKPWTVSAVYPEWHVL